MPAPGPWARCITYLVCFVKIVAATGLLAAMEHKINCRKMRIQQKPNLNNLTKIRHTRSEYLRSRFYSDIEKFGSSAYAACQKLDS